MTQPTNLEMEHLLCAVCVCVCVCLNDHSKERKRQDISVPLGMKSLLTLQVHKRKCTLGKTVDQLWSVPRDQHLPEHAIITLQIN